MKRPGKANETSNDRHPPDVDTLPELTLAPLDQSAGGKAVAVRFGLDAEDSWEAPCI